MFNKLIRTIVVTIIIALLTAIYQQVKQLVSIKKIESDVRESDSKEWEEVK